MPKASIVATPQSNSPEHPPKRYVCADDIDGSSYTPEERLQVDRLWTETLAHLKGFLRALETPKGCLDAPLATTQTRAPTKSGIETRCLTRYRDVQLVAKHVRWVLEHPDQARDCFDTQRAYDAMKLYTPNATMKKRSKVAAFVGRPTLEEFYANREGAIGEAGRELAGQFDAILANTSSQAFTGEDVTYNGLPELWSAVGWIPMYADHEKAINPRFRGGYAYAEVMGPWGLLRIDSINGEPVGAEIGMTIQLRDSFYIYHFHHPQELYMTLTDPSCVGQNKYMVMNWDNPAFRQEKTDAGWRVQLSPKSARKRWFQPHSPNKDDEWLTYFERNAIHAMDVGDRCKTGKKKDTAGLVTIWARTTARDNVQSTKMCSRVDKDGNVLADVTKATPDDRFACDVEDWEF